MKLVVYPVPTIEFSGPSQVCGIKTADISVLHSGTADSIWNFEGSHSWKSNEPSLVFSETSFNSASIEAGDWGDYEIYYHLKTIDDCEKPIPSKFGSTLNLSPILNLKQTIDAKVTAR
jgi:hypothetical protein